MNTPTLRSLVDRIEKLEDERAILAVDIREVYAEAKSNGFNVKVLKRVVAMRKQDQDKREEELGLLDVYMHTLGMLVDTPLGEAAIKRELQAKAGPPPAEDHFNKHAGLPDIPPFLQRS